MSKEYSAIDREDWLAPLYCILIGGVLSLITAIGTPTASLMFMVGTAVSFWYFANRLETMMDKVELRRANERKV